ncbi:type 1 glutamine amidotransferase domain-containing protein [Solitalea canadensis]|nr:type 1 glutamine amidotransferase domain-containing protein [Solitalea canadensis]
MITTSHSELGNTGHQTGVWLEELAAPYYIFKDAGAEITIASPKGGQVPLDPKSEDASSETEMSKRFSNDREALLQLAKSVKIEDVKAKDFDAAFLPGGHGPMWDLSDNYELRLLLEDFYNAQKPIGSVCHGVAGLIPLRDKDGHAIVKGKNLTSFSNTEEELVGLTKVVPFLLETELKNLGANYSKKEDFAPFMIKDGLLITGQNPASSEITAKELLNTINK